LPAFTHAKGQGGKNVGDRVEVKNLQAQKAMEGGAVMVDNELEVKNRPR